MIRVGIFFGGSSREREVSFAGGRTVYDNLDKRLFKPVPLFVDSWGNICELDWKFIYKGSIRDFYPPQKYIPASKNAFQIYAEHLGNLDEETQVKMLQEIGKPVRWNDLKSKIDVAFLALHGPLGEDGTIQGLLEWAGIPYTGCGILPSAIGINKSVQKPLQKLAAFSVPDVFHVSRRKWLGDEKGRHEIFSETLKIVGKELVVKSSSQGSSIGVSILKNPGFVEFEEAVNRSFFTEYIQASYWNDLSQNERINYIRQLSDIRSGIGMPVLCGGKKIYHPEELLKFLNRYLKQNDYIYIESLHAEQEVLFESFIDGREFSCIVIEDEKGTPVPLPPTEIVKKQEVYDYRSKYLPGLSRKVTPIDLPEKTIQLIRKECIRLYQLFSCNVYARIDGFITQNGIIYLNDPNTTSGMMPSSFFFHQAAEIGLDPSRFLTYIIRNSLSARTLDFHFPHPVEKMLERLDYLIEKANESEDTRIRVAVIMGGYSSERHISVESGRNIYEKLSGSTKYRPFPVFLTGNDKKYDLYTIPVNIMLKDNADDIADKVKSYKIHPVMKDIRSETESISLKYCGGMPAYKPAKITISQLKEMADVVFIALHGRPGEDGVLQEELEKVGLPYNGSGIDSSRITINKFETNSLLREFGFPVADSMLISKKEWNSDQAVIKKLLSTRINFPMIVKPADDGCSSAVKKIYNEDELKAYAGIIFRDVDEIPKENANRLQLKRNEEFPRKSQFLVETLIQGEGYEHFLEITGGLLTHQGEDGKIIYELFEPSETLAQGEVLSLEEKFLAGEGQNITPARFSSNKKNQKRISKAVRKQLKQAAKLLQIEGYARIDAFVKINDKSAVEVNIIEVNSLPGMTPATCIFHQCALEGYTPYMFIDAILSYGMNKKFTKDIQVHIN